MNEMHKEVLAFVFVMVFAVSMFLIVPRQYPHVATYKFALETEKAIREGGGTEPFYMFARFAYSALGGAGGAGFNGEVFGNVVMYLPVFFGLVSSAAFYIALRTRLGPEMSIVGALLLASSPSFLINSSAGVYTPEMMSIAIFSVSLALFLVGDVLTERYASFVLAVAAGILLGANLAVSEAGVFLAVTLLSSAAVQLIYYIREGEYKNYAIRFVLLLVCTAPFLQYAKMNGLETQLGAETAISSFALMLPLITLFAVVAIADLVKDTKKYELFFLAMALGSAGVALYDPVASGPGIALGAAFGAMAAKEHRNDRWLVFLFTVLVGTFVVFPFITNFMPAGRALALSGFIGVAISGGFLLYESEALRKNLAFGGISLLLVVSILSGLVVAQRDYSGVDDRVGSALVWAGTNLPKDAVVGAIGPKGMTEYLAQRKGCDCEGTLARFLLSGSNTTELKDAGASYIIVDEAYFDELDRVAVVANVSRAGIDTYFFAGYYVDQTKQRVYGYMTSRTGDTMQVPVDSNLAPSGEDVFVEGSGSISFSRIRRFYGETGAFRAGSKVVLLRSGERNNLFDIYFETPRGLELVYPNETSSVRIYRVS